jgi:hypothetical protein
MRLFGIGCASWSGLQPSESLSQKVPPTFSQVGIGRGVTTVVPRFDGAVEWTAFGTADNVQALVAGDCFFFAFQASGAFLADPRWRQDRVFVPVSGGPGGKRTIACHGYWDGPQNTRCVLIPEFTFLGLSALPGGAIVSALNTLFTGSRVPGLVGLGARVASYNWPSRSTAPTAAPAGRAPSAGERLLSICRAVPWLARAASPSADANVLISRIDA